MEECKCVFRCRKCGKEEKAKEAPVCCGAKMELPLEACTHAYGPEHSRPMDDDEPCDDSRGG
jgi:hypothetical protein